MRVTPPPSDCQLPLSQSRFQHSMRRSNHSTLLTMSTPSHLCSVCSAIIKQTPTHEEWQRGSDHHRTYEDFHAALDERCFICTVTWRHVKAQSRSTTLDDPRAFMPTKYELYLNKRIGKRRGSQYNDLISLKIEYWDTPRTGLNCTFGLIPTSGE